MRGQQLVEALQGRLGDANGINRRQKSYPNRKQDSQRGNETRSPDFNQRPRFPLCDGGADHTGKIAMPDTHLESTKSVTILSRCFRLPETLPLEA